MALEVGDGLQRRLPGHDQRLGQRRGGVVADVDEARAGRRACRLESLRLLFVHQEFGDHPTATRLRRVTQREWEFGKTTIVVLGEVNPRLNSGRIYRQY